MIIKTGSKVKILYKGIFYTTLLLPQQCYAGKQEYTWKLYTIECSNSKDGFTIGSQFYGNDIRTKRHTGISAIQFQKIFHTEDSEFKIAGIE